MKFIATSFLIISMCSLSFAQSVERFVVSSAGQTFEQPNFSMDWTLGEPVVKTVEGTNYIITQGFQQTIFVISSIEELNNSPFPDFSMYPNPASEYFFVDLQGYQGSVQYVLSDINGSIVQSGLIQDQRFRVGLSGLANTTYILKLNIPESALSRTYRIQKAQ